mgnify:CR=1 FL=1
MKPGPGTIAGVPCELVDVSAAVGSVWLRARWGRWQSWLVSVPALAFFGISVADNVVRLLPNLL